MQLACKNIHLEEKIWKGIPHDRLIEVSVFVL